MVLSPRLEISQKQKLMMNPQMRQAIELLQLTNIQLTDMLKREMEQNPFLAFDADHFRDSGNGEAPRAVTVDGTSGVGLTDKIEAVRVNFAGAPAKLTRTASILSVRPTPLVPSTVTARGASPLPLSRKWSASKAKNGFCSISRFSISVS